jgi:hypothetical protein
MAYIKSYTGLSRHPKFLPFKDEMRWSKIEAAGFLHCFWHEVLEFSPNGIVSKALLKVLPGKLDVKKEIIDRSIKVMLRLGFLDKRGDSLLVHDWLDYAGSYLRDSLYRRDVHKWELAQTMHGVSRQSAVSQPTVGDNQPEPSQPEPSLAELSQPEPARPRGKPHRGEVGARDDPGSGVEEGAGVGLGSGRVSGSGSGGNATGPAPPENGNLAVALHRHASPKVQEEIDKLRKAEEESKHLVGMQRNSEVLRILLEYGVNSGVAGEFAQRRDVTAAALRKLIARIERDRSAKGKKQVIEPVRVLVSTLQKHRLKP